MIIDLLQPEALPQRHSPVCIVGAGAAGISLAVELAKLGTTVTVLESGGAGEEKATQDLYASEISGVHHAGIHNGRFRILGGTTTRWAGQILELDSHNFEVRPWVANSGWPFQKDVLTPYYQRAIELEGLASGITDDESVWRAIKSPPPDFGDQLVPFFSRWCPQPNFAALHRQDLSSSEKVAVCLHANLREILLTEGQQAIAGLRCQTLTGQSAVFTADRYVFCLGGIESARVLLQPLADGKAAPWNASGLVGRYFQDHLDATILEVKPLNKRRLNQWFDNVYRSALQYRPYLKLSFNEQRRRECLAISSTVLFQNGASTEAFDRFREVVGQVRHGNKRAVDLLRAACRLNPRLLLGKTIRRGVQGRAYNPADAGISLRFHCEQSPNTDSRIELTADRDATGMLRTRLHWAVMEQELHTVRQFAQVITEAFERTGFGRVVVNRALETNDSNLIHLFEDAYHHMGATRMADSPQRGVVDANLRIFGIDNGYVCSSSVFPSSGFANPTHTVIALACRLAEHLAGSAPAH